MTQLEWIIEETKRGIATHKSQLAFLESVLEALIGAETMECLHEDYYPASMATVCLAVCKGCGAKKGPSGGWVSANAIHQVQWFTLSEAQIKDFTNRLKS